MPALQLRRGETLPVVAPVLTPQAVEVGDIVALSAGNVIRAEDFTWTTDLPTTQAAFTLAFLGISGQRKVVNVARVLAAGRDNRMRIDCDGFYEADCASATFNVGDFVGPAKAAGNALLSQTVIGVADAAHAIGVVVEQATSVTRVRFKALSKLVPQAR